MKISSVINNDRLVLSFEVFPPKTSDNLESVKSATGQIAALKPGFMSVTCGAGGTTDEYTSLIAQNLNAHGVATAAHLTCVGTPKNALINKLDTLKAKGIENILALRGDLPEGMTKDDLDFRYACELVSAIKEYGGFCIGGACYPEGHTESANMREDIKNLKTKVDAGCEFLTSQMFFDNNIFYSFLYKIREAGITVPVLPGIMPVTNAKQITRICRLSGTYLPQRFKQIVDRFGNDPAAMKQAGIAYATDQIIDLFANGINTVHVYSMNKPDVADTILNNLSEILK